MQDRRRITSYNVCYTKLLRIGTEDTANACNEWVAHTYLTKTECREAIWEANTWYAESQACCPSRGGSYPDLRPLLIVPCPVRHPPRPTAPNACSQRTIRATDPV